MIRTQIQLTENQAMVLKELALASNESIASLIRQAIDRFIVTGQPNRSALYRQALLMTGKYEADQPDISEAHDRYLEEAFGS